MHFSMLSANPQDCSVYFYPYDAKAKKIFLDKTRNGRLGVMRKRVCRFIGLSCVNKLQDSAKFSMQPVYVSYLVTECLQ